MNDKEKKRKEAMICLTTKARQRNMYTEKVFIVERAGGGLSKNEKKVFFI